MVPPPIRNEKLTLLVVRTTTRLVRYGVPAHAPAVANKRAAIQETRAAFDKAVAGHKWKLASQLAADLDKLEAVKEALKP